MADISVIIPAFNADKFLGEAITTILEQTEKSVEIIVVDDGSTDDTQEVANSFPMVRYFRQANQGTSVAINTGISKAKGDFLAFLDADDLWLPHKLEKQKKILDEHDSMEMVFTMLENFITPGLSEDIQSSLDINTMPISGIHKSTLLIRRNSFFRVGWFLPSSKIDLLDWYARALELGIRQQIINETLVRRRIHGENQSMMDHQLRNEFPKILKSILDRRRR